MNWRESRHGVAPPELAHLRPWLLALVFFGAGDVLTTSVGLAVPGVVEAAPIARALILEYGVAAMVGLKLLAFAACVALWRAVPRPYCRGVPVGLAALGVSVTLWNTAVVLIAIHP
jgi:hypothetical protein